jgi:hypothetical protein
VSGFRHVEHAPAALQAVAGQGKPQPMGGADRGDENVEAASEEQPEKLAPSDVQRDGRGLKLENQLTNARRAQLCFATFRNRIRFFCNERDFDP